MKKYVNPEVEYVRLDDEDILTASSIVEETETETETENVTETTGVDSDMVHDGSIFG